MSESGPSTTRQQADQPQLSGNMGVVELVLTVLAFTAPAVVVTAQIPFVIQFGLLGAPAIFAVAMVLLLLFAVGYVAMTRYLPNPGAFYAYITAGLGKLPGLGASFVAIFGYGITAVGAQVFFGIVVSSLIRDTFGGPDIPWYLISLAGVVIAAAFGYYRIDLSAKVLSVAMAAEVIIVTIYDLGILFNGGPAGRSLEPFSWTALTSGSVAIALLFAATSFLGFEATAVFREEAKDPKRTVTRATYASVLFIGLFYVVTTWLTIVAYGDSAAVGVANDKPATMVADAAQTYVGTWSKDTLSVLVCTSIFAVLISVQNITARYLFSLAADRALPSVLARVHPRHGSPYIASLTVTAVLLVGVLLCISAEDPLVVYIMFAGTGGFAIIFLMFLTGLSVITFFYRRRSEIDDAHTLWDTLIAPAIAAIGIGIVLVISIKEFALLTGSEWSAVLMQILLWSFFVAGIVAAAVFRRTRPDVYARIGRQTV